LSTYIYIAKADIFILGYNRTISLWHNTVIDLLCTTTLQSDIMQSNKITTMDLCANRARVQDLCVDSITTTSLLLRNVDWCTNARAYVSNVITHTQTVGDLVSFDTVVDDPNNSILQNSNTSYIAPKTGYYIVTSSVTITGISGPVVTGMPVSLIQIDVNGLSRSQQRGSFLSFSKVQSTAISALVMLNTGDRVEIGFSIIVIDPVVGEITYPGIVALSGSTGATYFSIHYLSSMCPPFNGSSACDVQCAPVNIACADCTSWCETHSQNSSD
jgi:hypothetical protein